MPDVPKDTTPKLNTDQATPDSLEPTEESETALEVFTRLTLNDPRFTMVKPSGKAFVILGAKP